MRWDETRERERNKRERETREEKGDLLTCMVLALREALHAAISSELLATDDRHLTRKAMVSSGRTGTQSRRYSLPSRSKPLLASQRLASCLYMYTYMYMYIYLYVCV